MQEEGVDKTWKLLVKKVTRARVMSALASRQQGGTRGCEEVMGEIQQP